MSDFVEKVPFTSKDMLREFRDRHKDPYGGMFTGSLANLTGVGFTSGTTGDPTIVTRFTESVYAREYWHIGARPGDFHANVLFTFRSGVAKRYLTDLGIIPILFTHAPRELPRVVEASLRFRPTTMGIVSTPLLNAFHDYFEKSGQDPTDVFASYHGAIFGGESLADRFKLMTKSWGLELFETTTVGDVSCATECWVHDGMHCCEDQTFIECLDPNGTEPVPDGQIGELVVTALDEAVFPVVRYRTDDLVTMDRAPCACGRSHVRIKVHGRKGDLVSVGGRSVLPRDVLGHFEGQAGVSHGLFQIVRSGAERDVLLLRVGHNEGLDDASVARVGGELREAIGAAMGLNVEIELVPDAELLKLGPPHKIPRVVKQ